MRSLTKTVKTVHQEVRTHFGIAISGAFAFVLALSWNDFMKEALARLIQKLGLNGGTLLLKLLAAVLTTIICVLGIKYFSRWGKKN